MITYEAWDAVHDNVVELVEWLIARDKGAA